MKYIFMLLTLFVITAPVLAVQADRPGKCLDKNRININDFEFGQSQPKALLLYFSNMCMPESVHSVEPQYFKLLQRMDADEQDITIQAGFSQPAFMNS